MAKRTKPKKRKYTMNYCIGVRIELPAKYVGAKDLVKLYRNAYKTKVVFDSSCGTKVQPQVHRGLVLARAGDQGPGIAHFSVLLSLGTDLNEVERLAQIINVLGDGKLIRERADVFRSGKSVLNLLPELSGLKSVLEQLATLIPHFFDTAWLNAPEAKLR